MPNIEKKDLAEIEKLNEEISPCLAALRVLVRAHPIDPVTYKNLNVLANKISADKSMPDFKVAFLGLIGITKEKIGTFAEFKETTDSIQLIDQRATQESILHSGFPFVIPKLRDYTREFNKLFPENSENSLLCEKVITQLDKLEAEVGILQKKFPSKSEEKTSTSSPSMKLN